MTGSRVSAVIPVLNGEAFVAESVRSVLSQSLSVYECIVVDDGSTDGTRDVLAGFGKEVRVIAQPPGGVSAARNAGMRAAVGDAIAFLDADDVWLPHKLETQLAAVAAGESVVASFTGYIVTDARMRPRRLIRHDLGAAAVGRALTFDGPAVGFSLTGFVTREAAERAGGFDEGLSVSADLDYVCRLRRLGNVIGIAEPLSLYRVHSRGQMHRNPEQLRRDMTKVLEGQRPHLTPRAWQRARANVEVYCAAQELIDGSPGEALAGLARAARRAPSRVVAQPLGAASRQAMQRARASGSSRMVQRAPNVDDATVRGFGDEWETFDQIQLDAREHAGLHENYFAIFPWHLLPNGARGADIGCGSGRWARLTAPRVGHLTCVDASAQAVGVARRALADVPNCSFVVASVDELPFEPGSLDFAYSLGVLHHVPDTAAALRSCAKVLAPGAPFLVYLYYALDGRPLWYRLLWRLTDAARRAISRRSHRTKMAVSQLIALLIYFPLARLAAMAERSGRDAESYPLAFYRHLSFYTMRTDAYDRFSTRLERRFTREEIGSLLTQAGFRDVEFADTAPYWCATAVRAHQPSSVIIAPAPAVDAG